MREGAYPEWVTTDSERRLHDDFRAFLWLLWTHLGLPPPTRRQLAIARYLQSGPSRRIIMAYRGAGKTWITCAYALWRLYRNPNERVKVVSANEAKAIENATFMRRLIDEVEQLRFLRPRTNQRDSVLAFDVGPAAAHPTPSVSCVGITGQLTGGRATILISDDVEVPKNSYTETMRERLAELVKEYDALVVPEGFDIVYLGTPQTEQSVYNEVRKRGYDCRIWPARYPEKVDKYVGQLAPDLLDELAADPSLAGKPTDPSRFDEADLLAREMSYGKSGFALQFMLDTTLSDALRYPLKLSDLIVMDQLDPAQGPVKVEWTGDRRNAMEDLGNPGFAGDRFHRPFYVSEDRAPWTTTVMVIDPSGRGEDETAFAVMRELYGSLFLVRCGGFRDGYSEPTLQALALIARDYGVNHILYESNFGDGMFGKLFEPVLGKVHPCTVEEYRVSGQKELRIIDDLEPVLNQHRLVVERAVILDDLEANSADPRYSLFYQLTHLTKDRGSLRHDDRLEVVSRACRYFRERLAQDRERTEIEHRAKLRDKMLDEFLERAEKKPRHPVTFQGPVGGIW